MLSRSAKWQIFDALQSEPDVSGLCQIPPLGSRKGLLLLRWLDQSGLALYFLSKLQASGSVSQLPCDWRTALEQRKRRNANRLMDMLQEFQRLNQAFRSRGIQAITLKGFSLVPDFCEDPGLRHQTDFDFLVDPKDVEGVAEILSSFGYSTPRLSRSEESCFTTPLAHVPSASDDLYVAQYQRQVDLHVSLAESSSWIQMDVAGDCLEQTVPLTLSGVQFHGLSLADRFVAQALHAFRHSFRSWLRLSWLLEIGHCLEIHRENEALWMRVIDRAGNRPMTKRIFAFVIELTRRVFQTRIPLGIRSLLREGMTPTMHTWLDHFSLEWAASDWPGSLNNLVLASEFIQDKRARNQYFVSRLFPKGTQFSIETGPARTTARSMKWYIERWKYVAFRSGVHLKDAFRLPLEQFRWKRALAADRSGAIREKS